MIQKQSILEERLRKIPIYENFEKHTIKFTINRVPSIKLTQLGDEIGLLGALALGKYILDKNKILL